MPERRDDPPPGRDDSPPHREGSPPRREDRDDDGGLWRDPLRQFAHYSTAGIMFPVAVALGFWLGWLIDGRLETFPWFSFAGVALGFAAAIRNLLQTVASDTSDGIPDDEADG